MNTTIKEACFQCPYNDECCSTKYRKILISGGILALNMDLKMQEYENILKYMTRFSTVEPAYWHIEEFLSY